MRDFKVDAIKQTRRCMLRITPQAERPVFFEALMVTAIERPNIEELGKEIEIKDEKSKDPAVNN